MFLRLPVGGLVKLSKTSYTDSLPTVKATLSKMPLFLGFLIKSSKTVQTIFNMHCIFFSVEKLDILLFHFLFLLWRKLRNSHRSLVTQQQNQGFECSLIKSKQGIPFGVGARSQSLWGNRALAVECGGEKSWLSYHSTIWTCLLHLSGFHSQPKWGFYSLKLVQNLLTMCP